MKCNYTYKRLEAEYENLQPSLPHMIASVIMLTLHRNITTTLYSGKGGSEANSIFVFLFIDGNIKMYSGNCYI